MSYLRTGEAARMCGVGVNTIKRWIHQGRIPCLQTPGGHWRIPRKDFLHFMATLQPEADGSGSGEPPRILIIDDDVQACDILCTAIASSVPYPCEIECAHDGCTGLIQVGRLRPSLLVLDIMMPEINGLELLHRLRAQPGLCNDMKTLVYTAAGNRPLVMRKLEASRPDAILLKPIGIEAFLQTVMSLLQPETQCVPGQGNR